ncbi:type IV pilus modification PilV family protein [Paludisphaera soli]|uniref:type IV pilus modification PilV family protein n=1 Tax=Paludisphaera soli TaxID=2712865 RepID=UPI0013EC82D7|nr:hypothetical protein [Paludisphaera soli]
MIAQRRRPRRGSLLIEAAMAALMLMIAMTVITKVVAAVAAERRTWDRRQAASAEAANLIERLSARSYDSLVPGPVQDLAPPSPAASALPGVERTAEVTDEAEGGAAARRVAVQIRWRNRAGDWDAPVRLTTWVHRRKEGS